MKCIASLVIALFILSEQPTLAQQAECDAGFADTQDYIAEVFVTATSNIEDGIITWENSDWDEIVRQVVFSSESFLNHCAIVNQPLTEQSELLEQLALLSFMRSPIESLDIGGDFGDVVLSSNFTPNTEFIDLNGDEVDELVLHTQVPYFSHDTVYQIRGGLSIAFFFGEDGWQGQVIAPISHFVTDATIERLTYAMSENHTLSAQTAYEALVYFPAPDVQLLQVETTSLIFITLYSTTGTGEAKELAVLTWEDSAPVVKLRVAFDDWCYPGRTINWEIREDGSVFIPSNGGEKDSPLHCGRTPEVLFQWQDGEYTPMP
jgi:hypothetical protein